MVGRLQRLTVLLICFGVIAGCAQAQTGPLPHGARQPGPACRAEGTHHRDES